ncbi:MAG TPA: hypothetical protein VNV87_07600 [Acidimicrobiales bacterium]|jgi:hypothetical protein|nr:hypothetical protein [Acidimicrobiales bacterium]
MLSAIATIEPEIELARELRDAVDAVDSRSYLLSSRLQDAWAGRDFESREQAALTLFEASGVIAKLLTWYGVDDSTAAAVMDALQTGIVDMIRL